LQKIGAAQQRCLLHITKWGVTLALQDSRSILAMWPLKTIRNYEYTGQCQFTLEAGRRSPMGEGLYMFYTNIGQDEEIFSIIDAFVAASLDEKAQMQPNKKSEITDDDILKCYDELHKSAIGLNEVNTNQGYDRITHSTTHIPLPSREPSLHRPPDYNQLFDNGTRQNSMRKEVCAAECDDNYDQLDYKAKHLGLEDDIVSLPSNSYDALLRSDHVNTGESTYDHMNKVENNYDHMSTGENNYDHMNTVESSYDHMNTVESSYDHMNTAESNYDHIDDKQRGASHNIVENNYDHINAAGENVQVKSLLSSGPVSPKFFPLRDEPSVPFLDDNEVPFTGRGPLSSSVASNKSEYEFRNSIYAPMTDGTPSGSLVSAGSFSSTQGLIDLGSRNNSDASQISRHDSNSSGRFNLSRNKQSRASSSFKDKSIQDIADHFLYQVPSLLSTTPELTVQSNNNGILVEEDLYQNHGNASKSLDS